MQGIRVTVVVKREGEGEGEKRREKRAGRKDKAPKMVPSAGCMGEFYSFHPHTCRTKLAMLTFLFFMSSTQGCSSIRQGVALRGGSFSRLEQTG